MTTVDEIETQIDCPFCQLSIDGDYWPCKPCKDTGKINKRDAAREKESIDTFNNIMNQNRPRP